MTPFAKSDRSRVSGLGLYHKTILTDVVLGRAVPQSLRFQSSQVRYVLFMRNRLVLRSLSLFPDNANGADI